MTSRRFRPTLGACAVLIVLAAACQEDSRIAGPDASSVAFSIVSGNTQSAPVNTQLPNDLQALVTNSSGQPLANFVIDFVVTSGGGSVYAPAVITNAQGDAQELWTLGPRLGPQTVQARGVNATTGVATNFGSFTATGLPPHNIKVVVANSTGIVIENADGTGIAQLTTGFTDFSPFLSADHSRIVFFRRMGTGPDSTDSAAVFLMNADGSNAHKVGRAYNATASFPELAANDSLIVLVGSPNQAGCVPCAGSDLTITVMDTAGHLIVDSFGGAENDFADAAWTLDGKQLVFTSDFEFDGGLDVFLATASSAAFAPPSQFGVNWFSNVTQLTKGWDVTAVSPSPDGQHIAFLGGPASTTGSNVYTMDMAGGNITQLTTAGNLCCTLSWSPDGTLIAITGEVFFDANLVRARARRQRLHVLGTPANGLMNNDGTDLVQINGGGAGRFPLK